MLKSPDSRGLTGIRKCKEIRQGEKLAALKNTRVVNSYTIPRYKRGKSVFMIPVEKMFDRNDSHKIQRD